MKKIMILALLTLFAIPTYSVLAAESPASNNTAQTDRAPYCWGGYRGGNGNYGGGPGWQHGSPLCRQISWLRCAGH